MVVESSAENPTRSAFSRFAASMNLSGCVSVQVDDTEAGVLEHDRYDRLADVVHVPEDRPDDEGADRFLGGGGQQGANEREAGLHRPRGDEHLRNEDDLLAEAVTLQIEAGEEAVI